MSRFAFINSWIDNPEGTARHLVSLMQQNENEEIIIKHYRAGDVVLQADSPNDHLYFLISGLIALNKKDGEHQHEVLASHVHAGSFFGLVSFFTAALTQSKAIAEIDSEVLILNHQQSQDIIFSNSLHSSLMRQLIIANLAMRYYQVVELNLATEQLNDSLKNAMRELKVAHQRLIQQEKMATLGQLVAGIAHEINNPAAAMISAINNLAELMPHLIAGNNGDSNTNQKIDTDLLINYFNLGRNSQSSAYTANTLLRDNIRKQYPKLNSSQHRLILAMDDTWQKEFAKITDINLQTIILKYFDAGIMFRSANSAGSRISGLIKSLKTYSKQHKTEENINAKITNIFEGINDTLQLLSRVLKNLEVAFEVRESEKDKFSVMMFANELNQVWTNLIINATEAMQAEKVGKILIRLFPENKNVVCEIHDNGCGISPENLDNIFKEHFTTHNSSGHFGLGLGLAISRAIIIKHGGTINAGNSEILKGAMFRVVLPGVGC